MSQVPTQMIAEIDETHLDLSDLPKEERLLIKGIAEGLIVARLFADHPKNRERRRVRRAITVRPENKPSP